MILAVIAVYFVATLAVGVALNSRIKRASDYLVAGRNLNLLLTTASLAAVQIGAGIVLGGAENGAALGIWPGAWYGLGCGGGLILAGLLAAKRMRSMGGFVPIDFFAARYGERRWVRVWAWLSNIPSLLGIFAAQLMAVGSVLSGFGIEFSHAVLITGGVILISNVMSGMWGVVAVDFVQVFVIMVGIPIAAIAALRLPESPPLGELLNTAFIPDGQWSRAVFLITPFLFSISVSYDAYIRYQSARTVRIAQYACLLSGVVVIAISICAALIGAAGKQAFPNVANQAVLTQVTTRAMSPILGGLFVSAILAAAMSTANALLISLAGCWTRDLYNKVLHPSLELDELPHGTLYSRLAVAVALVLGVVAALHARGILDTIILFNYPYMGSMLVPLLGGVLWSRATRQGAYAAMAVGGGIGLAGFVAGLPGRLHGVINVDLALLLAFAASAIVMVVVSLMTAPAAQPAASAASTT